MPQPDCPIANTLEARVILTEAEISLAKADLVSAPIALLKTTNTAGTISELFGMLMQTLCLDCM